MDTKYFVDVDGKYIGAFDGAEPPDGAVEVPNAPDDAGQTWDGSVWGSIPVYVPDRVTANQFGQQMIVAGIKTQVDAWVALQSDAVQWAYARSATFVREDPMMQTGFTALGFTSAQIDQFFIDASKIGAD